MKIADQKIKRGVEYSDLKPEDKVLIKNYNKTMGVLIFQWRDKDIVCWETLEGNEVYNSIEDLKEKKTKLIGVVCS